MGSWFLQVPRDAIQLMGRRAPIAALVLAALAALGTDSVQGQAGQAAPAGRGGRGRGGRGGGLIPPLLMKTDAFEDGGIVPERYAGRGGNVRPGFTFSNIPDGTVSFAMIFHDLDVASTGTDDVLHWLAWNIPAKAGGIPEGASRKARCPERRESAAATISDLVLPPAPGTITMYSNSTR